MAELRLNLLLEAARSGETVTYKRRYLAEGRTGLQDRSRRPKASPARIDPPLEAAIRAMRTEHPRWGARRIRSELERRAVAPPAVSTIHQALRRGGLVATHPPKRRPALKRFEREISNDLWQIDATRIRLQPRGTVWVLDTIDDHSRYLLAATAARAPTGEAAWDCFEEAASRYGLPRQVLSDNGLCFSGRLHGVEVQFERSLKELGVEPITAGPYHPQTLGKLERFHRTLKLWLHDEGPAFDLAHLQELLDAFRHHYNRQRPHQGIGDLTPAERYLFAPPVAEAPASLGVDQRGEPVYPPHSLVRSVSRVGNVGFEGKQITVGKRWAGARVRVVPMNGLVHIFYGDDLIRVLALDPARYNHPLRKGVLVAGAVR